MVDVDAMAECSGGGTHPAASGHYRFRTERVYLPRHAVQTKKSSTNERVKLAKMDLRRYCAPLRNIRQRCVQRNIVVGPDDGSHGRTGAAAKLHTTLVL
jgi:hypothetical protein